MLIPFKGYYLSSPCVGVWDRFLPVLYFFKICFRVSCLALFDRSGAKALKQEHAAQAAAAQAERELAEAQRLIAEHRRAEEVRKID